MVCDFPGSSDGIESVCNAAHSGSIPIQTVLSAQVCRDIQLFSILFPPVCSLSICDVTKGKLEHF